MVGTGVGASVVGTGVGLVVGVKVGTGVEGMLLMVGDVVGESLIVA